MSNDLDFERLDTRLFKAFKAAADTLNFTHAAKRAAMTQSGMSQHISKLEEQLGSPLFKRLPKSLQLTQTGKILLQFIDQYNDQVSALFEKVGDEQAALSGRVSYAMPNSCLASPHLDMLLQKRLQYAKDLILDIEIIPNSQIIQRTLNGEIDFGFVTEQPNHPQINSKMFCDEEYVLVGKNTLPAKVTPESLLQADFVGFPGMEVYYKAWLEQNFPGQKNLDYDNLRIMSRISTLEGAFKLLKGGVGWAIIPHHAIMSEIEKSELQIYSTRGTSVKNAIYIVTIKDFKLSKRVDTVIKWFYEMVH